MFLCLFGDGDYGHNLYFVLSDFVVFYTYELSLCLLYLRLYLRTLLAPWEEEIGNALEEEEQKQQQHVVAIPIFPPQFYLPLLYDAAAGELISMQQLHSIA